LQAGGHIGVLQVPDRSYLSVKYLPMDTSAISIINILQEIKGKDSGYFNTVLANVNNHVVRVSVMTESYFWHLHPNSDETFMVLEGSIFIDLEDKTLELFPGQLLTIPRNVKHRTRPNGDRTVNLTIELADLQTVILE
jgi:mannose-6-phosphate isomerase-like protein (cupin superfamily)